MQSASRVMMRVLYVTDMTTLELHAAFSKATDYLQGINHVKMIYDNNGIRYVSLNLQTIFDELVTLYSNIFQYQMELIGWLMKCFTPPSGVSPWDHVARAYISGWIHDLYVSNYKAVASLSGFIYRQYYRHEEQYYSLRYDKFLVHLNAAIRPTQIKGTAEETTYVPIIHDSPAWDTDNPFNIENFVFSRDLLSGLLANVKGWKISTIVSEDQGVGRPTWLFDWHGDKCCAWFPRENYTVEDVTLAYIVGAAYTENFGPKDVDDRQNGNVPEDSKMDCERVQPRRFIGNYEVRTFEQRQVLTSIGEETCQGPPTKRQRTLTASGTEAFNATPSDMKQQDVKQPVASQFKILDWAYYHNVVKKRSDETMSLALSSIMRLDFALSEMENEIMRSNYMVYIHMHTAVHHFHS